MLKKEKLVKRICCLMMATAMLFGCVYVSADETDTGGETAVKSGSCGKTESDSVTWNLSDDGILTISGTGAMADYDDPTSTEETAVKSPWADQREFVTKVVVEDGITRIGKYCFARLANAAAFDMSKNTTLTEIANRGCYEFMFSNELKLGDSVLSVGDEAFRKCRKFKTLTLGKNATYGQYCFAECQWTAKENAGINTVNIPRGVKAISDYMFYQCNVLKNLFIGDTVESIGKFAFRDAAFEYVILPESVKTISEGAFVKTASLKALSVANDNIVINGPIFSTETGKNPKTANEYNKTPIRIYCGKGSATQQYINDYFKEDNLIYSKGFQGTGGGYDGTKKDYVYPQDKGFEFINGYLCGPAVYYTYNDDKTEVEISADENSNLDKTMNTFVWNTSFKESPLKGKTDLKEIKINDGVTNISNLAFEGCTNVELLTVPSTVEKIGGSIFANNKKLKYVLVPNGTAVIENGAFNGCPNSMKVYGYKDSTAQTYAESKGFPFSEIDGNTMIIPEIANGKLSVYAKEAAENANIILKNSDSTSIVPKTVNLRVGLNTIKADDLNISAYADGKCYLWDSISGMHPKCAATTLK